MGLSIAYHFEARGTKRDLHGKLAWLKDQFQKLPVGSVGDVVEIERAALPFGDDGRRARFEQKQLGLAMLFARLDVPTSNRKPEFWPDRMDRIVRSGNGLSLTVDVGEGCEYFHVLLGRLGRGRVWYGARCTKTQYAERFADAHLTVIRMLELCDQAGILRRVCDDGRYWETRDLAVLAENLNASTEMLKAVTSALKMGAKQRGLDSRAAIDHCQNYLRADRKPPTS